jgi:hypothetical protein
MSSASVIGQRHRFDRADFDHTGVVDQHVNRPEGLADGLRHSSDLFHISYVTGYRQHRSARTDQIRAGPLQFFGVARANRHARPARDELAPQRQSQSPRPARGQRGFAAQVVPPRVLPDRARGQVQSRPGQRQTQQ